MSALLKQAQKMPEQMMQAQAAAEEAEIEGQSGGGVVKVRVTGGMDFLSVTIDPTVVDPDDIGMLEDLVLAAIRDAVGKTSEVAEQAMGGIDLGSLGGLLGGLTLAAPATVYAVPVQDLIDELGRLPGVGPKSAQRIAFHLLKLSEGGRRPPGPRHHRGQGAGVVLPALLQRHRGRASAGSAPTTGATRDADLRGRGAPGRRRRREDRRVPGPLPRAPRRHQPARGHRSRPAAGAGAARCASTPEGVAEVILCTNPNIEGEATAMYLARLLKPLGLKTTRIASGLPVGGDLEYADELTLGRALEGRRTLDG